MSGIVVDDATDGAAGAAGFTLWLNGAGVGDATGVSFFD